MFPTYSYLQFVFKLSISSISC